MARRAPDGPGSALDRLVEVEEELQEASRRAREEADALVEGARERARELLERLDRELEREVQEVRERVAGEGAPAAEAARETALRRSRAWEELSTERIQELAVWVAREVVLRQGRERSDRRAGEEP